MLPLLAVTGLVVIALCVGYLAGARSRTERYVVIFEAAYSDEDNA